MICIYDKHTTKGSFDNNGLGILSEAISCIITEELNGDYSLELEYPANSNKSKYIEEWNIIKADGQLFRIYKVEKKSDTTNIIKAWAKHIFYDLAYYFIEDMKVEDCSVKTALIKSLTGDSIGNYTADSDIVTSNSIHAVEKNPVEVIFSIIDIWGCGQLKRDNFDIKILGVMGKDAGVLIAQGKNIVGLKFNVDTTNIVTKLYPIGKDGLRLTEKYIAIPNYDYSKYPPFPIIKKVEFNDVTDETTLRLLAKTEAKHTAMSKTTIDIDFIELTKTKEYENYKHLQSVSVGDLVIVRHKDFNIDVKVPVLKVKKDILNSANVKIELGQAKKSLFDQTDLKNIKTTMDSLGNKVAESLTSMFYYDNATDLVISNTKTQPIYLGITSVAPSNLTLLLSIYGVSDLANNTLTIQIQLDNKEISFTPKQKLMLGDNVIGIPLGIPQIPKGAHYIGVLLSTDTGTFKIPKFNLQLMIDGRNLQGGLSAEPPHAEVKEKQDFVDLHTPYFNSIDGITMCDVSSQVPMNPHILNDVFTETQNTSSINRITNKNQIATCYISQIRYGNIWDIIPQASNQYSYDKDALTITDSGMSFITTVTPSEFVKLNESIQEGAIYTVELADLSKWATIETLEVK